jgi:hypothetical protein
MRGARWVVWCSGLVLIAVGIGALIWSRHLVSASEAPGTGWWQGTAQAMGVGLIVGGLVDVLAISGLDRAMSRRQRINDSWRTMLDSEGQYPDRRLYEKALDVFFDKHYSQISYLDTDVFNALGEAGCWDRLRPPGWRQLHRADLLIRRR